MESQQAGQVAEGAAISFSPREMECLSWCVAGKTAWETSRILGISEWTVVYHLEKMKRKLGVSRKQELPLQAVRVGIVAAPLRQ
jgi:DNA-binding CsgD family transcriptional regulator